MTEPQEGAPRPGKVLIVEDDETMRYALHAWCKRWGYDVLAAEDGASGLQLVATFRPDVVLLDLGLPQVDGIEVAVRIRQDTGHGPFVIALTGRTEPHAREDAMRGGCNIIYTKPADLDELRRVLAKVMQSSLH